MLQSAVPALTVHDRWIEHHQGRLFSRTWTPARAEEPAGQSTSIVLFHDSLGCVELWRDFPSLLAIATGRPVVAYDRLGFGRSGARSEQPSLDFVAEEASIYFPTVREQLGLERFVAFGHSVGGGMGIHCAAAFPGGCEALVTVAAQVFAEERTLEGIRAAREQFRDPAQVERLAKYHGAKARWVLDAWIESWLHPDFACWTMVDVLPRVVCPVLALHGDRDEYGSTAHVVLIGEGCARASRVEILPDTGHVPHRERQESVLALVSDFLGGRRPVRAAT